MTKKKANHLYYERVDSESPTHLWFDTVAVQLGDVVRLLDRHQLIYGSRFSMEAGRKLMQVVSVDSDEVVFLKYMGNPDFTLEVLHSEVKFFRRGVLPLVVKEAEPELPELDEDVVNAVESELVPALQNLLGKNLDHVSTVEGIISLAAKALEVLEEQGKYDVKGRKHLRHLVHKTGVKF